MLAAGAAAEVAAGEQDGSSGRRGLIEFKLRIRRTVGEKPPVEEEKLPEAGPLDPLEELLGNDLVGVDIDPVERGDDAGIGDEGIHARVSEKAYL